MGKASEIGLIPEKLGDAAPQTKETVAKLLNMSVEEIDQKLAAKWVKTRVSRTNWNFA